MKLNLDQLEHLYSELSNELYECKNRNFKLEESKKAMHQELKS